MKHTLFRVISATKTMKLQHRIDSLAKRTSTLVISTFVISTLMLILTYALPAQALFDATVNQSIVGSHETFELNLRTDVDSASAPDLAPLSEDFEILGTRQNRQIRIINGQTESWRDWIITLMPKQTGDLMIPSLALGSERSQPINISVRNDIDDGSGSSTSPVFILAEVNSEEVYVQQEIVFTLQILYRVQLYDDSRLTPLTIEDAIVKQLGETRKFDTIIENTRYKVFELIFSIHPQQAGLLQIPSLTFNGVAADGRDPFAGSFFSTPGKPIVARSPVIQIDVKPRPDNYPANVWLPARDLTIKENWSQAPDKLQVGDAITRTITIEAEGLSSVQLPPVVLNKPEGVNSYPDKSSSSDEETPSGVKGSRTDAIAMIPTRAGTIKLPAVKYDWFDTENNQHRVAEIPERIINIGSGLDTSPLPATPTPMMPIPAQSDTPELPVPEQAEPEEHDHTLWKLIVAALMLLWLCTVGFWWYTRNQPAPKSVAASAMPKTINPSLLSGKQPLSEKQAFTRLEAACNNGDAKIIREQLKQWCLALVADPKLTTMAQYLQRLDSNELSKLCEKLDAYLYSGSSEPIDAKELLNLCRLLRPKTKDQNNKGDMNDIYPE